MGDANGAAELLAELLVRCRAGERAALDGLVRRFYPYVMAVARSILGERDGSVEDAVQGAFVTVLVRIGDVREAGAFAGWLRQVVRTECNRIGRVRRVGELVGEVAGAEGGGPGEVVERREVLERVRAAVAELPTGQRQAVEMYYLDEVPQADISRVLGVPGGTVKRRLHDARNSLRASLGSQLPL